MSDDETLITVLWACLAVYITNMYSD